MTIQEKREALKKHCEGKSCGECALGGKATCLCGYHHSFDWPQGDERYMTDAEIIGAYQLVFGETENMEQPADNKEGSITITKDELINAQAEALTKLTLMSPAILLIGEEMSKFAAMTVAKLFKEDKE